MILFPGLLNVIYFWVADSYLKAKKHHADAHEPEAMADKKESLLPTDETTEQEYSPKGWATSEQKPQDRPSTGDTGDKAIVPEG
eukprot:CAMPEP_0116834114 /NCGR_PEP_ID=MMETSP0418-20121206/6811_1 /TAXON_ID=1158023 /ORGANISM="Astrosyne radiata, Strain 13vi08-1A" /LENGTH=83 /DNA_ID=CAMNT_0004463637 /DNA_START=118 /DNA_END=369 /DNA_ORIENTATION=+